MWPAAKRMQNCLHLSLRVYEWVWHVCEFQDVGEALPPTSETGNLNPSRLALCHWGVRQHKAKHLQCVCVCVCEWKILWETANHPHKCTSGGQFRNFGLLTKRLGVIIFFFLLIRMIIGPGRINKQVGPSLADSAGSVRREKPGWLRGMRIGDRH